MRQLLEARLVLSVTFVFVLLGTAGGQQGEGPEHDSKGEPVRLDVASPTLIAKQRPHLDCSHRTLQRRLLYADLGLIVEMRPGRTGDDPTRRFCVIRHILKRPDVPNIEAGRLLQIALEPNGAGKPYALVFGAFDQHKKLGITELQWLGEEAAGYYRDLSGRTGDLSRAWFLLETEASKNAAVSSEAFAELEAMGPGSVQRVAGEDLRDFVLRRLTDSGLPSPRRHFYLTLLGLVGHTDDRKLLEAIIFSRDAPVSPYLGTAAEAYLRLGGEQAGHKVVSHFFKEPLPRIKTEVEGAAQAQRLYPAYCALREVAPKLEARAGVGEYLVRYSVLADLVLENALRQGDDRFIKLAIEAYHREGVDRYLRCETVTYIAGMRERKESGEQREPLDRFLRMARAGEPELHKQALQRLENRRPFLQWPD